MGENSFIAKLTTPKNTTVYDRTLDTLIALLPTAIASFLFFGGRALMLMAVCMITAVISAFLSGKLFKIEEDPRDLSAATLGLLIAFTMPSGFSVFAAAVCTAAAVLIPRMMFGGVECEIVSPAAFGAVMAFICFPLLFKYTEAFTGNYTDYVPYAAELTYKQLLFGAHAGAIGETPALFLLIGGLYLVLRRIITPIIPFFALAFTALWSFLFSVPVLPAILGGGVLLASIFLLTDRGLSPYGVMGKIAYAAVFSFICVIIRKYAVADEGVYFAVLSVNLIRPLFDAIPDPTFRRKKSNEEN